MDTMLVFTLLCSLSSSSPTPSSLTTSLQMGGFVCHGGKQPVPGWLLVSVSPSLHVLTVFWGRRGEATDSLTLISETRIHTQMFPAAVRIQKNRQGQRPGSVPQGNHFSSCDLFHNIKQRVIECTNSIYSSSLFQLFTKACTCCTLFLYITWTYEGVLMGLEHNSLCWPDSSSSTHFLLVSQYFWPRQLSSSSISLAFPCSLPSRFVPISTLNLSLTPLFLNHPILIYSVVLHLQPFLFFLYNRHVTGWFFTFVAPTEPQSLGSTTQVHHPPEQVTVWV